MIKIFHDHEPYADLWGERLNFDHKGHDHLYYVFIFIRQHTTLSTFKILQSRMLYMIRGVRL